MRMPAKYYAQSILYDRGKNKNTPPGIKIFFSHILIISRKPRKIGMKDGVDHYNMKVRGFWLSLTLLFGAILFGCGIETTDGNRVEDLDFTIVEEYNIPQALRERIEEQKEMNFKLTYECDGVLYIARGYGEQETGGYSISVKDVYLSSNAVCIETSLIGPGENETVVKSPSFPYIVVSVTSQNKNVCFL